MPYLSRIRLNPYRPQARRFLAEPQTLHAAVLAGIATQPIRERVLWRVEMINRFQPVLLILSQTRPDWSHLVEQAGWPAADDAAPEVRDYTPLLARLRPGAEFAFRLTANPVQSSVNPDQPSASQRARMEEAARQGRRPRGARLGHRTATSQLAWIVHRAPRWGFEIPLTRLDTPVEGLATPQPSADDPSPPLANTAYDVRISARTRRTFFKGHGDSKRRVVLQVVTYDGRLRVTDPRQLETHLLAGIGPAKAYGCGLMTLAPVR